MIPEKQRDNLKLAREKLNPNCLEAGLPGREEQHEQIRTFLERRLRKSVLKIGRKSKISNEVVPEIHLNKTIFLCGLPGTGKTATALSVVKTLEEECESDKSIAKFKAIYVNGLQLSSPERIYCEILYQLTGEKMGPDRAQQRLDDIITGQNPLEKKKSNFDYIVTIVDELDVLYSERRQQSVFYNLFEWPTSASSNFILIAIANAMDLSERFLKSKVNSRIGWDKVIFNSYTRDGLATILKARLGQTLLKTCFEDAAIVTATLRIARVCGDARRCLDICRQAIDYSLREGLPKVNGKAIMEVSHLNLEESRIDALKRCSNREKLLLRSLVEKMESVGDYNVTFLEVIARFLHMSEQIAKKYFQGRADAKEAVSRALNRFNPTTEDFYHVFKSLEGQGFVTWETNKPVLIRRVYLRESSMDMKGFIKDELELDWPYELPDNLKRRKSTVETNATPGKTRRPSRVK